MPWKALDFADRKSKDALSRAFKVQGIPTLVFLNARTGEVVTESGREKVSSAPEDFPWPPKPVESLADAMDSINDLPHAVMFTDKLTDAAAEAAAVEALNAVAAEYFKDGRPSDAMRFVVGADGDPGVDAVRGACNLKKDKDGPTSARLTIVDVPKRVKATLGDATHVPTAAEIRAFVAEYVAGGGPRVGLKA
jgi:hypothetical protein